VAPDSGTTVNGGQSAGFGFDMNLSGEKTIYNFAFEDANFKMLSSFVDNPMFPLILILPDMNAFWGCKVPLARSKKSLS
jgi:hypothetical protein